MMWLWRWRQISWSPHPFAPFATSPSGVMGEYIKHVPSMQDIPTSLSGIYIVGSSSSGKTTLCKALAIRLHLPSNQHVSEVARTVMRNTNFTRDHVDRLDMQRAILNAQIATENGLRVRNLETATHFCANNSFLLCDRSAIDPLVYASLSTTEATGAEILAECDELYGILPIYRRAIFVLLHPIAEWIEDDGVRSLADPSSYPQTYKHYMDRFGIKYYEIDGSMKDLESRVNAVLEWVRVVHPESI
ncbi:MobB domain-containing protein [Rhizoctonia solani AG-1 IA]|uniref:MobB domain-containing protein n=1 Tax=Thanatephorus cucumeris (strain AG1-IA) TaxID=983506 RepID=L8X9E2_THACA|nr:MobB domain-containing protein [Rhizoctonia solani AG-1 IA]